MSNGICGDLINIRNDFLTKRKQSVVLNRQRSSCINIRAGVPQGLILGPLLFLIYVKYLSNGLKSERKLFADDTSLLSAAHDVYTSASDINNDSKLTQAGLGMMRRRSLAPTLHHLRKPRKRRHARATKSPP